MILTSEQAEQLRITAQPLMDFLNSTEFHPHIRVIVTSTEAEIVEGLATVISANPVLD